MKRLAVCLLAAALAGGAAASVSAAAPEGAYPGVVALRVDATDLAHGIFAVRETLPVKGGGPITLMYPKWLPGHHSPTGPIEALAGLAVTAGGQPVAWRRDPADVYAFHLEAPAGAEALEITFQYLSPVSAREGRVAMTPDMLDLEWSTTVLYPAGWPVRRITVAPSVTLPAGFTLATALEPMPGAPEAQAFKPVSLETLVDSPLIAGRYFERFELAPAGGGRGPVRLNVMADRPDELEAARSQVAAHAALVVQADRLFGARHYAHYDFLLWLSDRLGGAGLEHHQSSEDGAHPAYFADWAKSPDGRDLLAHEYAHSWNGKFRRPADLDTPDFSTPMQGSLLWVYEGQTQYWGFVLAARAGLLGRQDALDAIALTAATYDQRVGRRWRPLQDTTNDPVIAQRRPLSWPSWQRSEDYYSEGELIWLDIDTLIRERTGGKRSLDDFARRFFGADDGRITPRTYVFGDVAEGLNAVAPFDWAAFLRDRLDGRGPGAPLDGLARGGYRLVYRATETDFQKSAEAHRKLTDLSFGLGLSVGKEGALTNVDWDGPAFKAGLAAETQIVAVNGEAYDPEVLKDAVAAARTETAPIQLLVKTGDHFRTVAVDYHGGLRYPRLERIPGASARLDDILAPRP